MQDTIQITGARENNLKNISLAIPKNKLVVLTGVSGSGKSTIAFETLQTECQRQYMESLGMVTDEFVRPKVDAITGLSPAISVQQNNGNKNPRSTVGTMTEIFTYLRILFAKLGVRSCPHCGSVVNPDFETSTCVESVSDEAALTEFEESTSCTTCGHQIPFLTMSHFSFNKPQGACETCNGIGQTMVPNLERILNFQKGIKDGAVLLWDEFLAQRNIECVLAASRHYGFALDLDAPLSSWPPEALTFLYYGAASPEVAQLFPGLKPPKTVPQGRYEGVLTNLKRRYSESAGSPKAREQLKQMFHEDCCPSCKGLRLKQDSIAVTVCGKNIIDVNQMSLREALLYVQEIEIILSMEALQIVAPVIAALKERLRRFLDVGVGYLSLDRGATSLSGGEAQRLRLASLLGSGLTGVLYVLDEPTTGLHAKDTTKLMQVLCHLRDMGNTVLVIEHDLELMKQADYIIDIGPGAGEFGGQVVACGTVTEVMQNENSLTGKYLSSSLLVKMLKGRRVQPKGQLTVMQANVHNLKNISVTLPLGKMTVVSGVSGSGKSTFVFDILAVHAEDHFGRKTKPCNAIVGGLDNFGRCVVIDQDTIGRSTRSCVATYTDVYTAIRSLYASLPAAKAQQLVTRHFSFNVSGGRCEKCEGMGVLTIPMHFMPDATVTCPACRGKRFRKEILSVTYQSYSIADVLDMSVGQALQVFQEQSDIREMLTFLAKVGLGYMKLGQSASTLSGGEAQRIKLARELASSFQGSTLYLLDEPTTGLHPDDVRRLVAVLDDLVAAGNTMVVVEHNMDVIAMADYVVDFGPDGGDEGGRIVATGTPAEVAQTKGSYTGACLAQWLQQSNDVRREVV